MNSPTNRISGVRPKIDPLSEVIALLRPTQRVSKPISGAGRWGVRYDGVWPAELLRGDGGQLLAARSTARSPHACRGRLRVGAGDTRALR